MSKQNPMEIKDISGHQIWRLIVWQVQAGTEGDLGSLMSRQNFKSVNAQLRNCRVSEVRSKA